MFIDVQMRGHGPLIVLIHGAVCDSRVWRPQLNEFSMRGFQAVALGLEGFYPDVFDVSHFSASRHVESICRYIEKCGQPVHLLGHSRGARLAIAIAARLPGCITSLVAVEPGGVQANGFLHKEMPPKVGAEVFVFELLEQGKVDEALRYYFNFGHGPGAWERAPALLKAAARVNAGTLYGTTVDNTEPLSRAVAMKIQAPTLLVEGTESPSAFSSINDVLEEVIPNVTRVRIESGDHFLPLKLAEQFNELVIQFVRKCETRASS